VNTNKHFIVCGTHTGSAKIDLQILNANQNVVADSPVYLQIKDIKNMYERWAVGDAPTIAPRSVAILDGSDFTNPPAAAFQYSVTGDTNTPYILFVHGWNMERWEKDRYAETSFKRLYWQGYQGRFGIFRWPTDNNFGDIGSGSRNTPLNDPKNYDRSESTAWNAGTGLKIFLTTLNSQYPENVYLLAHSMGNIVAGEALKQAGASQLVNTYVAMQGAVPSHAYDSATPVRVLGPGGIQDSGTPNRYAQYPTNGAPCYFNGSAGAGVYVNFFNTNDYALDKWQIDQNLKPDVGYGYSISKDRFYKGIITGTPIFFPADTYEIFSYCDEARCFAVGAQTSVGGVFFGNQVNLQTTWPLDTHPNGGYKDHVWHSAEFRSDFSSRAICWGKIIGVDGFGLK
jgi:pimeloyl-ACP methyl ester carboxylesterase